MNENYPLTHAQIGVFSECMRYADSLHYSLPSISRIEKGEVDADKLVACIEKIINTFSNYNLKLVMTDGKIRQTLREERDFHVTRVKCSASDVDAYIAQILRPFDIFNEQLVRVMCLETEEEVVFLHNFHHLTTDGTTLSPLYVGALSSLYNDGKEPEEKYSIFDCALEQEAYDNSPEHEKSLEFYKQRFGGKTFKPFPANNPSSPVGKALLECVDIPRSAVDEFVKQSGIRPNFLLEAAYNITLSAFTRSDYVAYLTLLHGRFSRPARTAHGMFLSTVPVGIDIDAEMPVIEFVRQFKGEMFNVVRNANFPLSDFLRINGTLPDTMYAYQGPKMKECIKVGEKDYRIRQIRIADKTTASFSVVVYETDNAYQLRLEVSDAYMDNTQLRRFGESMKACVESIIAAPDAPVSDVRVVSESQRNDLLAISTTELIAHAQPVILNRIPEGRKLSVVAHNGSLTYDGLTAQARNVACHLLADGVRIGDFVAVQTDRTCEYVVAVLGVMMAGAAYVPIDMAYPQDRIDFMIADSKAVMTLSADMVDEWKNECLPDVMLPEVTGDMKAYMIYTSGSTGKPKGVVISHAALGSFVASITQVLGISADDRIACHSSFSFDASIEDLFPVLVAGGTLFIVPENLRRDINGLAKWLNDNNITGGNYTTRFGQLLLAAHDLPHLRYLVVGGEKMTAWPERNRHIRVFNTYGPTECTVDATYYELNADTDVADIPIGVPMPGVHAFVCDHHGRLLPFGAEGELMLAGTQLASGYWGREDITAERFVATDFRELCYRTGDIVKWNDDSLLVYLHRDDGQVKVNGYRIELADVEAQMLNFPHLLEAKVVVIKGNTESLCAYFTADADIDVVSLKRFIAERLPVYMIPSAFVHLERMPVNVVGKLDVSQLPKPDIQINAAGSKTDVDTQSLSHDELKLLNIARQVTGCDGIGVSDPLYGYGFSSMQLIQMVVEAGKVGINIKMENVFDTSSIRDILSATGNVPVYRFDNFKTDEVDVVISGTTSLRQMSDYAKTLKHTVLLFPPVADDDDRTLEELCVDYMKILHDQLKGKRIKAFIGHSFGGEIAYRLASMWSQEANVAPELILIDTTLKLPEAKEFLPMDMVEKYLDAIPADVQAFWKEYYRKALLASKLHDEKLLVGYDGNITLYNALQRDKMFTDIIPYAKKYVDEESLEQWRQFMHERALANAADWQNIHPNIRIVDVNADHYAILMRM